MRRHDAQPTLVARFETRRDYDRNYIAASGIYRLGAWLTRRMWAQPTPANYPEFLARAAILGFGLAYAISIAVLLTVAAAAGRRMLNAVCATLCVSGTLEALFRPLGSTFLGLPYLMPRVDETTRSAIQDLFFGVGAMMVNPDTAYSPFGDTPRNHFLLLSLGVFALRWSGKRAAAYAMLLALSALHQSQTGLLAAALITTDVILYPESLRSWPVVMLMLSLMGVFLARESLDTILGFQPFLIVSVLLIAGLVLLTARKPFRAVRAHGIWRRASVLRERVRSWSPIGAELATIGVLWLGIHFLTLVGNQYSTPYQSNLFWAQVTGRLLAILRPGLLLAATLWCLHRFQLPPARIAVFGIVSLIPALGTARAFDLERIDAYVTNARALDMDAGSQPDWSEMGGQPEPVIYYSMARALDLAEGP
jgi:hypothetical protein